MFTLLDGLNRFLSFLNVNGKIKNRLYILLSIPTTGYIGYLSVQYFRYQAPTRGVIYLLIFLALLYFLLLNFFYYFTDKRIRWDISPLFEKYVAQPIEYSANDSSIKKESPFESKNVEDQLLLYDAPVDYERKLSQSVEAEYILLEKGQEELQLLVDFLIKNQIITNNYDDLKDKQIKKKTYAIGKQVIIPSIAFEEEENKLYLKIGINALEQKKVGFITKIGNFETIKMLEKYEIQPVIAYIKGGKYKLPSRGKQINTGADPYFIELHVLCQPK